jgi:hypothetical protein
MVWGAANPVPFAHQIEDRLCRATETEHWAASTFNHYRSLISLNHWSATRNRKAFMNPVRSVLRRSEDNNRVRFLSETEESRLCEVLSSK